MRGLHALSSLAAMGSLAAAADKLGVTRSALSHRVADLETQLGVALVRKVGRHAALTEDGERLLAAIGDALDRIEAAVRPLRRRRMQVRLSTVSTFASHWLIPRLPDLARRHPEIEVLISTTTRPVDLLHEDFDCAIRHGRGRWRGLKATMLFQETLMPVATPSLVKDAASHADSFLCNPLIYARSRYLDWTVWWELSGHSGPLSEPGLVVETRAQALEAALAGAGIAMMDMAYIARHVANGKLCVLADEPIHLPDGYYFVERRQGRNERMVRAVRDWLLEQASVPTAA
jgi:DNA-binding transcriptional LysR family regulator